MPTVSLPLSFRDSFWSQDYRSGLEVLYSKLEQGVEENDQVLAFLSHQALATKEHALKVLNAPAVGGGKKPKGFDRDEGVSLVFAFRGLEAQAKEQAKTNLHLSRSLTDLVETPFAKWTADHSARLTDSRRVVLDGWVDAWEKQREDARKLKVLRGEKARAAEVAEAEWRFYAPGETLSPQSASTTSSPVAHSPGNHKRSMTISERLKKQFGGETGPALPEKETVFEAGKHSFSPATTTTSPVAASDTPTEKPVEAAASSSAQDKPSIAIDTAFIPPSSEAGPPTLLLAGLALPGWKAVELVDAARECLAIRTIHLSLLGEYTGCFTGYELIEFLQKNVEGFGGSEEMAAEAARELVESLGMVRRVVAVGKGSWGRDEEFYQFTDKQFKPESEALRQKMAFPASPASPLSSVPSTASSLLARSGSLLSTALRSTTAQPTVALHLRTRQEANHIEGVYRTAVRKLDRTRVRMEEVISDGLVVLQRWEADRLEALKTVLKEYQRLTSALPAALQPSFETSDLLLDSYSPASDLDALIQRYRTGPFRPQVDVYEPFADANSEVVFGGDLFTWAESIDWRLPGEKEQEKEEGELLHPVVRSLLGKLKTGYADLPDDDERRKVWIYDVPLQATHALRDALVVLPDGAASIPGDLLKRDLPVIAATLRLWLLELGVPLGPDYDDVKAIYPSVKGEKDTAGQKVEELKSLLARIPKVRLIILDGIISHLRVLVNETSSAEPDETYISKLGHSLGRAIVRPEVDTSLSIEDRAPSVFVADLITNYSNVFPTVISARRAEVDKAKPTRKLTRPIDRRPSRSMMSEEERVTVQAQLIAGGARSPGLPGVPSSPGRPAAPRNENAARQESDEQLRENVENSKRISLTKLRIQKEKDDELPPGFAVQPPTPLAPSAEGPFDSAAPAATTTTEDKPFSPPDEDDDKPPTFTPPKDDGTSSAAEQSIEKPFSPPSEDAGQSKPFSAPEEDTGVESTTASPVSPEDDVAGARKTLAGNGDRKGLSASGLGGPRGPRVGGPRGARTASSNGEVNKVGRDRAGSFTRSAQHLNMDDE